MVWSRNSQDRYRDPGTPLTKVLPSGGRVLLQDGDNIFLIGPGAGPQGDHPFLDRYNLATGKSERLFRCDDDHYEVVEAILDEHGNKFLTRRESPTEPPNYFVRTTGGADDGDDQLPRSAADLPQGEEATGHATNAPMACRSPSNSTCRRTTSRARACRRWCGPTRASSTTPIRPDRSAGSSKRFTEVTGYSQLFHVLDGFAVLDNAAMPVVGDPDTVNNTYVEQIVADAKAAIDKAAEMGVTDPARVGVGGHSYGAFMTANLLAHCDLFKAGIAESGAHNRTLTPFGFQSERRTIWQAPDVYLKMSPFMFADKIKTPVLLIHGEADDNDGTFPIQSDRMYQAIRGNGGVARLVFLPFEAHGYRGKETIEHVLWEKMTWLDKYVKNAGSTTTSNNE